MQNCIISIVNTLGFYSLALSHFCHNNLNPIFCVATVCHQICRMFWGHLSVFHRAISHLNWYKMVCMEDLTRTFSRNKSTYMFYMYLQSGVPGHFLGRYIAILTKNLTVFVFMYVSVDPKLSRQYAEMWEFVIFSCCVHQGKYIRVLSYRSKWYLNLQVTGRNLTSDWLRVVWHGQAYHNWGKWPHKRLYTGINTPRPILIPWINFSPDMYK